MDSISSVPRNIKQIQYLVYQGILSKGFNILDTKECKIKDLVFSVPRNIKQSMTYHDLSKIPRNTKQLIQYLVYR